MKKGIIIFMAIVFSLFLTLTPAMADSESESESEAKATVIQIDKSTVDSTTMDQREHMTAVPVPLMNALPAFYKNGGWQVFNDPFQRVIGYNRMKKNHANWFERLGLTESVNVWGPRLEENDLPIQILQFSDPKKNASKFKKEVARVTLMGVLTFEGEPETDANFEETLDSILYEAKKLTGTKKVIVLYKTRPVTVGKVASLGSVGTMGKAMGPAGNTDKVMGAGTVGNGLGICWSYIDDEIFIKVLCFR